LSDAFHSAPPAAVHGEPSLYFTAWRWSEANSTPLVPFSPVPDAAQTAPEGHEPVLLKGE
jgi:hypothetical protein